MQQSTAFGEVHIRLKKKAVFQFISKSEEGPQ